MGCLGAMEYSRKLEEIRKMDRVNCILMHSVYRECLEKNKQTEEERVFCGHDLQHFLDVARLAYIFALERGYDLSKELIYAAALLHDIGKWKQYTQKIPHEQASAGIAEKILPDTGFDEKEKNEILTAILSHRENTRGNAKGSELSEVLYDADKISRNCYSCAAKEECDWGEEKKNLKIIW